jgi:serine/threonine protein kinase
MYMMDRVGQQFGNYRLIQKLGQGGFAEVYLATHDRLNIPAAIKLLHAHLPQEALADFLQEARTIAHLDHPHIVRVFDFDEKDGIPFLVMNYYPNGTLRRRHRKNMPLELPLVISYVRQIADALQYAHERRIVHRDVKPENMLVGSRSEILLADFGIAAVAHSTSSLKTQQFAGTMPYMAPEQIKEYPRRESDQYALAVVVYEWLAGQLPFFGTLEEIAIKHLMVPPPSLRQKRPDLPSHIESVVFKALAKDPRQRFPSVQDFALALEAASQNRSVPFMSYAPPSGGRIPSASTIYPPIPPTIAAPPIVTERARPEAAYESSRSGFGPSSRNWISDPITTSQDEEDSEDRKPFLVRRRKLLLTLAALGAVAAGGEFVWSHLPHPAPAPPPAKPLYTYRGHTESVTYLAWSPDDQRIASAEYTLPGIVHVWQAANGSLSYKYQGPDFEPLSLSWSPDGKYIATGFSSTRQGTCQIREALHGNKIQELEMAFCIAWSPNGRFITNGFLADFLPTYHLHLRALQDPATVIKDIVVEDYIYVARWSPNNKYVAFAIYSVAQIWDVFAGEKIYTCTGHTDKITALTWSHNGKYLATASNDNTARVWDAANGHQILVYKGHQPYVVNDITWSPDDKYIVTGGNDGTAQAWEGATGKHIFTYTGHSNSVNAVAWSHHGTHIATGSADKTVQIWSIQH